LEYSANREDIKVEFFEHSFIMPSVIARIEGIFSHDVFYKLGSSKDIGATRIILGGHEDSVGRTTTGRSPGADDDASGNIISITNSFVGTSTVLEVFRVLAQSGYKPHRTVEFHAYSGIRSDISSHSCRRRRRSSWKPSYCQIVL
jgi:leucyl aminopeptidase